MTITPRRSRQYRMYVSRQQRGKRRASHRLVVLPVVLPRKINHTSQPSTRNNGLC